MALRVQKFPPPPLRSPFWEDSEKTIVSRPWIQWFQAVTNALGASVPITGSRTSGVALENLLLALQAIGLVKDQTTP